MQPTTIKCFPKWFINRINRLVALSNALYNPNNLDYDYLRGTTELFYTLNDYKELILDGAKKEKNGVDYIARFYDVIQVVSLQLVLYHPSTEEEHGIVNACRYEMERTKQLFASPPVAAASKAAATHRYNLRSQCK